MKGLLLIVDMEGCIGIEDMTNYKGSCERMIENVEIFIAQAQDLQYNKIGIIDCHDGGYNLLDLLKKYPSISIVSHVWNMHEWKEYQDALLVGFHAMNGVSSKHAHTLRPEVECMKLGNNVIGEIEWLVNTILFYGIKLRGVVGERGAQNECERTNIPFWATDDNSNSSLQNKFQELAYNIRKMLCEETGTNYKYINGEIEIVFKDRKYAQYIPDTLFDVREKSVVFGDTIKMNEQIFGLCQFLNAGNLYMRELVKQGSHIVKKFYSKEKIREIEDDKFKKILFCDNTDENSIADILYIIEKLKSYIQ